MNWNAYHFVGNTLRDGRPAPNDGEVLHHDGALEMCVTGLHASRNAWQALNCAPGYVLCRVHCSGRVIEPHGEDKLVCSKRTIVARINAKQLLWDFARSCARDVLHMWDAPDVVREYLETGDEAKRACCGACCACCCGACFGYCADAARRKQRTRFTRMVNAAFDVA